MRLTTYTPNKLFDQMKKEFNLWNYAHIADFLEMDHSNISNIKNHKCEFTARTLLRVHEATGWSVAYIRDLLGDTSEEFFEPSKEGKWKREPVKSAA